MYELQQLGVAFKIRDVVRERPGLLAVLLDDGFTSYHVLEVGGGATHPLELLRIRSLPYCARH